uniref:Uncharacterized protein n=1 Tax=Oryza brachyantha TaxID=4533 RepID=J3MZ88_ORYBR
MEATAVSLARTVLDGVLGGAGSAVADEAALLLGVRREVDFIRDELEMMRSFLMATSGCAGDTARTWVKQVRDLAYDVEDCLLDFMLLQALSRPIWRMPETLAARYRVAARIRELKASVEELNQRNQRYNVVAAAGGVDSGPAPPPPHDEHLRFRSSGAFQESQDIGRGDEKRELIDLIDSGDAAGRRVVSVWAMGGMGKSSVARSVYNDPDLIDHFDCRAWVTVPHPLELDGVDEFKRRLGKQLGTANEQKDGGGEQKRHLIVVDDLRSLEEWGHIEPCLFEGVAGGLVIVTTRQRDVARHCAGGVEKNAYELKPLAHPHGMKLLCQKVYKNAEHTLPPHMLEEANKILGRCHGLPLAIATIGGLLGNRPKTSVEWMNLRIHLGSELEFNRDINSVITSSYDGLPYHLKSCFLYLSIFPELLGNRPKTSVEWMNLRIHLGSELEFNRDINSVITSSYDGLPYHLKSCFLYLSIFPENHEIRCTRLLRRWIAEGYITKRRDMTVEEVGQMHLNELMNRSMIRPMKKKIGASMAVERCQVHGVVLQIILSKSIEENQLFIIDKHCNEVPQSKIRHLVVTRWNGSEEKMTNINLSRVRSLTVFGECPVSLISPKLRLLRVLDLEDAVDLKNDDLMHIGDLYHLRYLGLRGTKISRLPSSLQNLKYLETLDVQDTKVTHLPDGTAKLEKLRYLLAGINFAEDLAEKMQENNAENNAAKSNANLLETFADLLCRC